MTNKNNDVENFSRRSNFKFSGALVSTSNLNVEANTTSQVNECLQNAELKDLWLTDSGASCHISFRKDWFHTLKSAGDQITVCTGDDDKCSVAGVETILIQRYVNGEWIDGMLENVLFVPSLRKNLFSTNVCTSKDI